MAEEGKPLEAIVGGLRSEEPGVRKPLVFVSRLCVLKYAEGWYISLSANLWDYLVPISSDNGFSLPWLTERLRGASEVVVKEDGSMTINYQPLEVRFRERPTEKPFKAFVGGSNWKFVCELLDEAIRRLNEHAEPMGLWYAGPGWEADHKTRTAPSIVRMDRLLPP